MESEMSAPASVPADNACRARRRILLVEDDAVLRTALSRLLRAEGFVVTEAADGEQGVDMARRDHPDLIVLDVMMPRVDGLGMLYVTRQDPLLAEVPVIVHSALRDAEVMRMAELLGARAFIVKDSNVDGLLAEVRSQVLAAAVA
jgi:CheY-like chemotaxis protein